MLHRITELSVKSANGTNSASDRQDIQSEINDILQEIDRISTTTKFNEELILCGNEELISNSRNEGALTYEKAKKQLLNGTYERFDKDVTLSNGQVLSKDEANIFASFLSNLAITSELLQDYYDYGIDETYQKAVDKLPLLLNNSKIYTSLSTDEHYSNSMKKGESYLTADITPSNCQDACRSYIPVCNEYARGQANMSFDDHVKHGAADVMYGATRIVGWKHDPLEYLAPGSDYIALSDGAGEEAKNYLDSIGISGSETYDICKNGIIKKRDPYLDSYNTGYTLYGNNTSTAVLTYLSLFNNETSDQTIDEIYDGKRIWIQSGAENSDRNGMYVEIDRMDTEVLGIKDLDASTLEGARDAIGRMEPALLKLNNIRSKIGAQQNRLEHTIKNQLNVIENTQASESLIRDADMADEMVKYSKEGILQQAGQAMLSQANQANQGVLSLLQ